MTGSATAGSAAPAPQPRDPAPKAVNARLFLRRAARVTILVPLMFWFTTFVLHQPAAGLPSSFALFGILVFANLGGPPRSRLLGNLSIVIVGLVALVMGAVTSGWVWLGVLSTFVAVFVIAYSAVLRGYFAAATSAIILPWVLGATSGTGIKELPWQMLGWTLGGLLACMAASLWWPYYEQDRVRLRLADVLDVSARIVAGRWIDGQDVRDQMAELDEAMKRLQADFDGVIDRPGSGTLRERSMMLAVDEVLRLRTVLWSFVDQAPELRDWDAQLARVTSDCLQDAAMALRGDGPPPPSHRVDAARNAHQIALQDWVQTQRDEADAPGVYGEVEATFDIRVTSLTAELIVFDIHRALLGVQRAKDGQAGEDITIGGRSVLDLDHRVTVWARLKGQWSWESPWFRTALRTATAIAIAVMIARLSTLQYSLWVSLGAMTALKFDASGTKRSGEQIVLGTFFGFLIGAAMITVIGDRPGVYWVLLPFTVFAASYTPGRTTLAIGQGSFTVFLVTMISISHPGKYAADSFRMVDIGLGVGVSLLVSILMWPHGAAAMVRKTISLGADQAGDFLTAAFRLTADGPSQQAECEDKRRAAAVSVGQAVETLDLAISARGPDLASLQQWLLVLNTAAHLTYVAGVVSAMATANPLPLGCEPTKRDLVRASERARKDVDAAVGALADREPGPARPVMADQARASMWAAINRRVKHRKPKETQALVHAAREDTTQLVERGAMDGTQDDTSRATIALAFAVGWAIQVNRLAGRLAALVQGQDPSTASLPDGSAARA